MGTQEHEGGRLSQLLLLIYLHPPTLLNSTEYILAKQDVVPRNNVADSLPKYSLGCTDNDFPSKKWFTLTTSGGPSSPRSANHIPKKLTII